MDTSQLKCLQQIDRLRDEIQNRRIKPGEMVGTEFAFAQEWGLSRHAVRRGVEVLVDEGLLERRPGKGLFVRHPHAHTRTVQVVVPNLAATHYVMIARGAQEAGRDRGVEIQIYDAHGQMRQSLDMLRRLPTSPTDGAIIISLHHRHFSEVLFELKAAGYPFVLVDQRLHDLEVPTVEVDNYGGAYTIGKELAAKGHSRVSFLGPLNLQVIMDRLNGFRDALADAHVVFDRSLVVNLEGEGLVDWLSASAKTIDAVASLLTRPDRPTAIFDASGDVAPFIYRAARQAGLRIPEDLSIVSFDDVATSFLEPEVARLRYPWAEMGKAAFEMLLERMSHTRRGRFEENMEHRVMTADWVPGPSLAAASL